MNKGQNRRTPIPRRLRFEVFKRDSFKCQYCGAGRPNVELHVDHIRPVAHGGTNDITNLITACAACNMGKGAVPLDDSSALATVQMDHKSSPISSCLMFMLIVILLPLVVTKVFWGGCFVSKVEQAEQGKVGRKQERLMDERDKNILKRELEYLNKMKEVAWTKFEEHEDFSDPYTITVGFNIIRYQEEVENIKTIIDAAAKKAARSIGKQVLVIAVPEDLPKTKEYYHSCLGVP